MEGSVLYDILERSKTTKEIICIWNYSDSEGFWSGYVEDYSDELIFLRHFTKYGKSDGIIMQRLVDIKTIDFDDDYSKAMQCIIDYSAELDKEQHLELPVPSTELWQFSLLKHFENDMDNLIKIEINGNDHYSGFVGRVTEHDFIFHCVGTLGEAEAKAFYRIEDVTMIRHSDIENRKRLMLYRWRKSRF